MKPSEIDYVNLHGTGTQANDRAEDRAIRRTFGERHPCSSTKGGTGHTLGAAGITEAIIAALCLRHGFIPGTSPYAAGSTLISQSRILLKSEYRPLRRVMSNSFGFGGNNCSLVFGKSTLMQVFLQSVGLVGPGLDGWVSSRPIFAGQDPYRHDTDPKTGPRYSGGHRTSAQQRCRPSRHCSRAGSLAYRRSWRRSGRHRIRLIRRRRAISPIRFAKHWRRLEREVSPTSFHNSVHNAPAGYWSIATGSRLASTSVCAYDVSFAAGLLEAAAHTTVEHQPVMLIASDLPFPDPLHAFRPVEHSFAAAILLTPSAGQDPLMRWHIGLEPSADRDTSDPAEFPGSLLSNPAARCLPLLAILARGKTETVSLDYLETAEAW